MNLLSISEELASKMTPTDRDALIRGLTIPKAGLAVSTLEEICQNKRLNPNARAIAAKILLDRGFGKPETVVSIPTPPGGGRCGVMLIPYDGERQSWLQLALEHHSKMLT